MVSFQVKRAGCCYDPENFDCGASLLHAGLTIFETHHVELKVAESAAEVAESAAATMSRQFDGGASLLCACLTIFETHPVMVKVAESAAQVAEPAAEDSFCMGNMCAIRVGVLFQPSIHPSTRLSTYKLSYPWCTPFTCPFMKRLLQQTVSP